MNIEAVQAQVLRMADLAWAAGVLDARGNFAQTTSGSSIRPRISYRPGSRWRRPVSLALQHILGGTVGDIGNQPSQLAVWTLSGAKACLEADLLLIPYLHLRARRAQMHSELCRAIVEWKPASFEERSLPHDEFQRRRRLAEVMARL